MKDSLDPNQIKANLKTSVFGQALQIFPNLPSTMDSIKAISLTGAPEGTVIIADSQTHGRGRHSRTWFSPPGKNIYCSILFRPDYAPEETQRLLCLALVATRKMIAEHTGLESFIKWPNDLVINGKKVAGFLLQNELKGSNLDFSVLGIGINVNMLEKDLLPDLVGLATSLQMETGRVFLRTNIIANLINDIEHFYNILNEEGFDIIKKSWLGFWQDLHQKIKIRQPGKTLEGTGIGLDDCGYIIIETEEGKQETIYVGDPV